MDPALLQTAASTLQFLRVRFLVDINHFASHGAKNKLTAAPFVGYYDI